MNKKAALAALIKWYDQQTPTSFGLLQVMVDHELDMLIERAREALKE